MIKINKVFSLQQNNSLFYTHVQENNCMGIMESLVSTNATIEASIEVQKFVAHVVGDNSICIIHYQMLRQIAANVIRNILKVKLRNILRISTSSTM